MIINGSSTKLFAGVGLAVLAVPRLGNVRLRLHFLRRGTSGQVVFEGESVDYRYGFNNQPKEDDIYGKSNFYSFEFRDYDAKLCRFLSLDPIRIQYSWNSPYAFAENRPMDGKDLEGKEWENFMSGFFNPGQLKLKLPEKKTAQVQLYKTSIGNTNMSFKDAKKIFSTFPQYFLSNSKAEFNTPIDEDGEPSEFKKGAYIKIDIAGPMNNSIVKVLDVSDLENSFSVTFGTMEGHVEKGIITFKISKNNNNGFDASITSVSEVDFTLIPNIVARFLQSESWIEVLDNFVTNSGGTEISRKVDVITPSEEPKE